MTDAERAALLGDLLTRAIDGYIASPTKETLGNFCAELLGRSTSMSAAVLVDLIERVEKIEGMAAIVAETIELSERVQALEAARDGTE